MRARDNPVLERALSGLQLRIMSISLHDTRPKRAIGAESSGKFEIETQLRPAHKNAAQHSAEQYGDEGSGFNQSIAANNFGFLQVLRQDAVLHRTKEGRLHTQQKQQRQHRWQVMKIKRHRR